MDFRFEEAIPLLRGTPGVVRAMLAGLPECWTEAKDGGSWTPFDIVGHLIAGERRDWVPRVEHLLRHGDAVAFTPFDREAMFVESKGRTLPELLDTFQELRAESLRKLESLGLTDADLGRRGRHPEFGVVTLGQHLATWVAHDLSHLAQIARIMGRQYTAAVGPWTAYLPMLESPAPNRVD